MVQAYAVMEVSREPVAAVLALATSFVATAMAVMVGGRSNKRSSNVPEVFKRVDAGTEWTFSEADKSGTGSISLSDYLEYMNIPANNTETHSYWVSWFNQHDTNGDGVITLDEAA
ncbi:hypothetical protein GQ53DRAFT_819389 [Thozetella sp. PMI_491]|nr:hypothetical protein GQ53DRAFT_819389 [Thozetella sp. PMI_491]